VREEILPAADNAIEIPRATACLAFLNFFQHRGQGRGRAGRGQNRVYTQGEIASALTEPVHDEVGLLRHDAPPPLAFPCLGFFESVEN